MSSSVRVKWCGVTSKVTRAFARLPRRTLFSASAVERCATCRRALGMCIASCTSRSTIEASAAAVMPRSPVHRTILGHPRVFGMLHDRKIQLSAENQRLAHNVVFEDGLAIVGDRN